MLSLLIVIFVLSLLLAGLMIFVDWRQRRKSQGPRPQQPIQQPAKGISKKNFWRWSLGTVVTLVIGFLVFFYLPNVILSYWQIQPGIIKELLAGVIIAGEIGFILGIIFLIQWLAANDLFWTIVKPKTAEIRLTFGGSPKLLEGKVEESGLIRKFFGGIRWLGIPYIHSIYHYKFHWLSFKQKDVNGRLIYEAKEEGSDDYYFVSLKHEIYFAVAEGAESADGVPVDIYFQLTLRVVNPILAIYEVDNWLEAVLSLFRPILADFIRQKELTELIGTPRKRKDIKGPDRKGLLDEAKEMIEHSEIVKHINEHYGVEVVPNGFGIADIILRDPKHSEALTKQWIAEREAERVETVYSAIEARGDTGMMVRTLEALEETSKNPNKTLIFPLGGIKDLLGMWIGGGRQQPNRNRPNRDERRNDK